MELDDSATNLLDCPVCLQGYNGAERTPKNFSCGHSICLFCIQAEILSCPICRKAINSQEKLHLSTNFPLLQIVQSFQRKQLCKLHPNYEQDHICRDDRSLICLYCSIYGDHKDHDVQPLKEFHGQVQSKLQQLESDCANLETFFNRDVEQVKLNVTQKYDEVVSSILIMKDNVLLQIQNNFRDESRLRAGRLQCITELKGFIQDKTKVPSSRAFEDFFPVDFEKILNKLTAIQSSIFSQIDELEKTIYNQFHRQAIFGDNGVDINIINGQKFIEVKVQCDDTIEEIKTQLNVICPELNDKEYDLIYNKKPLKEYARVSDYNIQSYIPLEILYCFHEPPTL